MNPERSTGTLLMAVAAAALLAFSLGEPWFEYSHSSGRKTAPGGFNDPADTRVERHNLTYGAFSQGGDVAPSHPSDAQQEVQWLGWLVIAALATATVAGLADLPRLPRLVPRWAGLALLSVNFAAAAGALALAWTRLPATLDDLGVTGPFTSFLAGDGYTTTSLGLGWLSAGISLPFSFGALLFKFQAGSDDGTIVGTATAR